MPDPAKPQEESPKPPAPPVTDAEKEKRDAALDEALAETFPASDPISTLRED
ncbi:hypothetical protein SAMN02745194_01690 [Roseomonas rosea]|uniref:Uncharacterized protein n=1 Tax=Muricoccus roseus TaxID=198092 RepID=A0A1M6GBZ3_9PROT|nr:hypothetical protein [Roseomonas rosea]SHJ07453.1 hypothetical protein SAMN02745194_01690 [Roseomonas rosea]